ncbi:ABC transporter permease [Heyndrickxia sporothermodurans]|uniref:Sugar ABC transporter permease n=2 Tax=Heyndrickxia sporothermodurans TaxID=46224 RepID=A0AB37HAT1_9BACI|nr:sugar ABC transporter permease [Heyndrickxia sporothermodurans]MBL5771960.1 sugar ABC transporter permease [Heyndrickxia sporothermodurans]MBL5775566.1 sugar ABC transporter permease [Heyndrickxia sporothermodurans]MBL5779072.1 sugar ABC transporter permease [Heyndrickxia sporothermodurans]MBL5782655.1 sugar ABC transporter permease [Heyndrickxia sporothermodurans]MBL5789736.1 sugar ABC transporter permease [Heyndrickxia sporothermodurans]
MRKDETHKSDLKKGKVKKKSTEKIMAYSLIAPALILILVISVWPVLQSFYFSMFDLKLNSPTKSETHLSYSFDLERYLDNYPFLVGGIDNEIRNGHAKEDLQRVKYDLQALDKEIQKNSEIAKNYDIVNDRLLNMEKVDPSIAILKIDKKTAKNFQQSSEKIAKTIKLISKKTKLSQGKKIVGLSSAMNQVVVEPTFIGFKHYEDNLTDKRMWRALGNTFTFTVISVFLELVLGLAIALLINKAFVGRGLIRATILIPWAIPTAVSALMWKYLYDGQNGIVAMIFEKLGLVDSMSNLLTSQAGAMFSVIFADVWKTTPYMALLLLAGLQTIPSSLYEAASIDGATKWKQFTSITLPLIKTSILVALLFRTLDAFRVFDLIWVMTGGGPANSTETISILAYKTMFSQTNFGDGSAISVIVFVCVAIISMIYIKFLGRDLLGDRSGK